LIESEILQGANKNNLKNVFSDASLDLDNDEPYLLLTKDQ